MFNPDGSTEDNISPSKSKKKKFLLIQKPVLASSNNRLANTNSDDSIDYQHDKL